MLLEATLALVGRGTGLRVEPLAICATCGWAEEVDKFSQCSKGEKPD